MSLTYILVDFENVQPTAQDIALVRAEGLRLWIFRGPGQKKYSADVAEAWQPLGNSVRFIQCAKPGRNALDMHIAFHVGRLIGEHETARTAATIPKNAQFVVVSRDTDYDPLLLHIGGLGYAATRVTTIKAALDSHTVGSTKPSVVAKAAKKATTVKAPAKKSAKTSAKKAAKTPATKAAVKAPARARPPAAKRATAPSPILEAKQKVIDNLRRMGEKRPAKRKALERHIESHLGRKFAPEAVASLLSELERDGVLTFNDKKVEYALPVAER